MRRSVKALAAVFFVIVCIASAILLTNGEDKDAVVFGDEVRPLRDGWGSVTLYTERESFTWSLMQDSQAYDYAMAEICVGRERAVFDWTIGETREGLTGQYADARKEPAARGGREEADYWLFLKVKTDDVYDLDIWHKVQEVWGRDLKDGHEIYASVNETGDVCRICEYDDGTMCGMWQVFIKDEFLYVLECVDNQVSSGEETLKPLSYFYWSGVLKNIEKHCLWGMDDELFYWRDHDERVIELENPSRVYIQVPGRDGRWSHFPGKQPCAVIQTAEYTTALSAGSPTLRIRFTLEGEAMEVDLPNIGPADHTYQMEVSDAMTGELLQVAQASLCVDAIDTLRFEDMDGDGYLDMHIVYPEHSVVAESDAEDQFSYKYYYYRSIPWFWIWDDQKQLFVRMDEWELSDRIQERRQEQKEENTAEKDQYIVVQEGDSLWNIAEKYLGDGAKYPDLYIRNKTVIGENPDMITPGMELVY